MSPNANSSGSPADRVAAIRSSCRWLRFNTAADMALWATKRKPYASRLSDSHLHCAETVRTAVARMDAARIQYILLSRQQPVSRRRVQAALGSLALGA